MPEQFKIPKEVAQGSQSYFIYSLKYKYQNQGEHEDI